MDIKENLNNRFLVETVTAFVLFIVLVSSTAPSSLSLSVQSVASLIGIEDTGQPAALIGTDGILEKKDCLKAALTKEQGIIKDTTDAFNTANASAIQTRKDAVNSAVVEFNKAIAPAIEIRKAALDQANKISDTTLRTAAIQAAYSAYNSNAAVKKALADYNSAIKIANETYTSTIGAQTINSFNTTINATRTQYNAEIASCSAK